MVINLLYPGAPCERPLSSFLKTGIFERFETFVKHNLIFHGIGMVAAGFAEAGIITSFRFTYKIFCIIELCSMY